MNRQISSWVSYVFVLMFSLNAHAQNTSKTDSLLAKLETSTSDSNRIDLYIALHQTFANQDTAKSLDFIQRAISLSKEKNDIRRLANSYLKLAYYYDRKGDLVKARNALDQLQKEMSHLHETKLEAAFYMESGIIYYFEGTYDKAVNDIWKSLKLYEGMGDSITVASCHLLIGESYRKLEDLDKALIYFQKGLAIYENNGDEKGQAMAMGNLGLIYKSKKDYEKALAYYQGSLQFNQKNGLVDEALIDMNNIGSLYTDLGDFEKALKFHRQSLKLAESIDSQYDILSSKFNLANLYDKTGNHKAAISEFKQLLVASKKLGYKDMVMDTYQALSNIYEHTAQYKLALDNLKIYESLKDSIISEDHLTAVKEMELKYETEKKEKQIVMLASQNEIQERETVRQSFLKVLFMTGSAVLIVLLLLIFFILRQRLHNQKLLASKNKEIYEGKYRQKLSELELKALRAQINPHFIFNCMNSINQMILEGENHNASKYLTKFGKLIRLILENTEQNEVALSDELAMIETYIQLESLRFNGEIEYEINIQKDIEIENTYLPSMVLQPFVENAIWHGLLPNKEKGNGRITISISQAEGMIIFQIQDNGIGRERALKLQENSIYKSRSLGLKITEERLRLLSKELKRQWIKITDLKDTFGQAIGTQVEVIIGVR